MPTLPPGYSRVATEDPDFPVANTNGTSTQPVSIRPLLSEHNLNQVPPHKYCKICTRPIGMSIHNNNLLIFEKYCSECIIGKCRGCGKNFQRPMNTDPYECNFYRCPECRLSSFKSLQNSCNIM